MAQQQNGYAYVPHATYNEFRQYALTHGVNVDYAWGNQCWDICAIVWYQYGLRLKTGPNHSVYECWTVSRMQNAVPPFSLVTRKEDIKRGDIVVFNRHGSYTTGHIGFADEDYRGTNYINILGQNQGQGSSSGTPSDVRNSALTYFLGAFRNSNWIGSSPTPPTPTPTSGKKKRFPWVLYANKLRQSR